MRHWTLEERQRQAELIKHWKPWVHSTGAKTPEGKDTSKMNATKHGMRGQKWRILNALLKHHSQTLEEVQERFSPP